MKFPLLLFLTFSLFLLNQTSAQIPTPSLTSRYLTVTGTGKVEVEPTKADISIAVDLRNETLAYLVDSIDTISAQIVSNLSAHGVKRSDIQTSLVTIQPNYFYNETTGESLPDVEYYSGYRSVTFTLRNFSNFDSIISDLYAIGINTINGVAFGVEDENPLLLRARARAARNARDIAETITKELDVSLGFVSSINDQTGDNNGPYYPPYYLSVDMAKSAAAPSAPSSGSGGGSSSLAGGKVTFDATVQVTYELFV